MNNEIEIINKGNFHRYEKPHRLLNYVCFLAFLDCENEWQPSKEFSKSIKVPEQHDMLEKRRFKHPRNKQFEADYWIFQNTLDIMAIIKEYWIMNHGSFEKALRYFNALKQILLTKFEEVDLNINEVDSRCFCSTNGDFLFMQNLPEEKIEFFIYRRIFGKNSDFLNWYCTDTSQIAAVTKDAIFYKGCVAYFLP